VVARHLDLRVVGEGVEAEHQARYLNEVGCDFLQGFHIGTPQPGDRLTADWSKRASEHEWSGG
jgi:EAL domain-containing protein (putative c-di-GMP-specific phosphodiesterase class I)